MAPVSKVVVKDRGMKRILQQLDAAEGWQVTIGAHAEDSDDRDDADEIDNVALLVFSEFGVPSVGIPERSSLRAAFDKNVKKYVQVLLIGARKIVDGTGTPKQAVALAGEVAVADVVNLINAGIPPPNELATIEAKGSSTPLIHTKQMAQSIKPVVEKK